MEVSSGMVQVVVLLPVAACCPNPVTWLIATLYFPAVGVPVIKLPRVSLQYSYPMNVLILDKITEALKMVRDSKSSDLSEILALVSADTELANANLWK